MNLSKDQIINKAIEFHIQGNINEATRYYKYLIEKGIADNNVFSNYGAILQSQGKLKEAEISYRKAIELNPNFANAYSNLGIILQDMGILKEAEISYRKAIELNPNFANAHLNLGNILSDLGNLKEAEISYRKAIELNPNFADAYYNLGQILGDLGNLKEVEISYRKVIEINPNYKDAYLNLGNLLRNIGKLKEAEMSYRKAIELNPNFANGHLNLGNVLRDIGKLKEAEISYRKAIKLNPNFAQSHCNLGNVLRDIGKLKEAEISYRKAIELSPNFAQSHCNLGNVLRDIGKLKEAEMSYRKAIELNPNFANANSNLGNVLRDIGKLKEAESFTRKAIELDPNLAMPYSNLGNLLRDIGKLKEAESFTRKAIELDPDFALAHLNLGNVLRDIGKLKEAELSTRKAIELKPDFAQSHCNLGNVLIDIGKLKEAEISYRKAIVIDPDLAEAFFNLFLHYDKINDLEKLKESLQEFRNNDSIRNELLLFQSRLSFRNKEYGAASKLINNISNQWLEKIKNNQKIRYWSYKGFIEDKLENYDIAYGCFKKSQDDSSYTKFGKKFYLDYIDSYRKSIINKTINLNYFNDGIDDSKIVFLIGFPRSGTTLLNVILESHPDIEVMEEKPLIEIIEKYVKNKFNLNFENIYNLSKADLIFLRQQYFKLLWEYNSNDAKLVIDKLPLHTVCIPLINLIFPNSKIIFTYRNPYDTVLSCFQQTFNPNYAMANLLSLESSSILYDKVMNAWDIYKNNHSLKFIESKYENLIENFDQQIGRILTFLDIEWHENIKNYRKTALQRGRITTPSSSQVVQPLYRSSIEKWKSYEKYFENCHQYLKKWSTYFNY